MRSNFAIPYYNFETSSLPKVLLVEDNYTAQMIFQFHLSKLNIEVVTVGTGNRALQALQEASYDMMILDIGLPDITGEQVLLEAQKKIQNNTIRQLPIILVTAHGNKENLHTYIEAGASEALIKPISFKQLHMLYRTFLVLSTQSEGKF